MSFNQVTLMGRVGQEPQIHTTKNGVKFATFSLATNRVWTDKNTGERKEQTDWHQCITYNRRAETVEKYVKKGDLLLVSGSIYYRSWETDAGEKRYNTDISVNNLTLMPRTDKGKPADKKADAPTPEAYASAPLNDNVVQNYLDDSDIPF